MLRFLELVTSWVFCLSPPRIILCDLWSPRNVQPLIEGPKTNPQRYQRNPELVRNLFIDLPGPHECQHSNLVF